MKKLLACISLALMTLVLVACAPGVGAIADVGKTIAVSLSEGHAAILQGYPQTVSATASPASPAPTWSWLLNGSPITTTSDTPSTLTLDTSALSGPYELTAVATSGIDSGSAKFPFQVYPNDSDMTPYLGLLTGYACNKASVEETSRGVYVLSSGPGADEGESELDGGNPTITTVDTNHYLGGKAFLGIPGADGKMLTKDFKVSFTRTIDKWPAKMTKESAYVCMYFNLIVEGTGVHNAKEAEGGRGVLVAATPEGLSVVLDGSAQINGISGGTIDGVVKGDTLDKLLKKEGIKFVNAVTKDNGTPIDKKLASVLIIVGDSLKGNMSDTVMTVSNVSYSF